MVMVEEGVSETVMVTQRPEGTCLHFKEMLLLI